MLRKADIARKTKETDIRLVLNLDGEGSAPPRQVSGSWTIC